MLIINQYFCPDTKKPATSAGFLA